MIHNYLALASSSFDEMVMACAGVGLWVAIGESHVLVLHFVMLAHRMAGLFVWKLPVRDLDFHRSHKSIHKEIIQIRTYLFKIIFNTYIINYL